MRLGVAVMFLMSAVAVGQTPTKGTIQMILDPVQAKYPGNYWVKPCGPDNHDAVCFDPKMLHVTNSLYSERENCERRETVKCSQIGEYWAPIGKPVLQCIPDGLACTKPVEMLPAQKAEPKKSISPTFTMPIGGMDCCTDEQMGIPSCPKGYVYNRPFGARNGTCDLEQPRVTKPSDITDLMERIAPTKDQEKPANLACDTDKSICAGTFISTVPISITPPSAEYHDSIDDKGVYHANFTDPNNKWRCQVVGFAQGIFEITGFTLACAETHEVKKAK